MQRSFLVLFSLLFSCNVLWAQLPDSVLIEQYGAIRAEMVKTVCHLVGYDNQDALQAISNSSLSDFKNIINNQDTLLRIIKKAQPLSGSNIDSYDNKIRQTRQEFRNELERFYPQREAEIERSLNPFIGQIDNLTKQCRAFNSDTSANLENYSKAFPEGIFTYLVDKNNKNSDEAQKVGDVSDRSKETSEKKEDKDNPRDMVSNLLSILGAFLKWIIIVLIALSVIIIALFAFKKRKKIFSFCKKIISAETEQKKDDQQEDMQSSEQNPAVLPDRTATENKNKTVDGNNDNGHQQQLSYHTPPPYNPKPHNGDGAQNGKTGSHNPVIEKEDRKDDSGSSLIPPQPTPAPPVLSRQDVTPNPPPTPPNLGDVQVANQEQKDKNETKTAIDAGEWIVVGASVQGNSHIEMNTPCQDNHGYEYLGDGWGIAVTSDGAGSAKLSHTGSAITVNRALFHFKTLINNQGWIAKSELPSDGDWMKLSYHTLKAIRNDLDYFAKKKNHNIKDFNATVIVLIHSPFGALVTHVGDGRAGYKGMDGAWHSLITPHKGEEANQTIFLPSDFWDKRFYEMSGVAVPESRVIREQIAAFTLMSDGCENTSWLWNQYDETTKKYYDPNIPHANFFNSLLETLQSFRNESVDLKVREEKWYSFLKQGNQKFKKEPDDKTMILGALYL